MLKALVVLITEGNDYQLLQAEDAKAECKRLGIECEVVFGEGAIGQIHHIYHRCSKYLDAGQRPSMLVIESEPVGAEAVRKALEETVMALKMPMPVAVLHHEFPGLKPTLCVTSDPGALQARQVLNWLGKKGGSIWVVTGPSDAPVSQQRLGALQKGLAGSNVKIVDPILPMLSWNGDEIAKKRIRKALASLKGESIDLAVCQNDPFALAVVEAQDALDVKIPAMGIDGTPDIGRANVDRRVLEATIEIPSATGPAIRALHALLEHHQQPEPRILLEPKSYPVRLGLEPK